MVSISRHAQPYFVLDSSFAAVLFCAAAFRQWRAGKQKGQKTERTENRRIM